MLQDTLSDLPARQIRLWTDTLIDLTRRNPLLSLSLKSKAHLALPNLSPDELLILLTKRKKSLTFVLDKSAPVKEEDEESQGGGAGVDASEARFHLYDKQMSIGFEQKSRLLKADTFALNEAEFKRLNTLRQRSILSLQEQGINTLFITMGLLEWIDPHAGSPLLSPLLLVPVSLERLPGGETLRLTRYDDDIELNPTLCYRLSQRDLQVSLPEVPDEDAFPVSDYLDAVERIVSAYPEWKVQRECRIGRYSFLKLAMYRDLQALEQEARTHPVVAALAGDRKSLNLLPEVQVPSTRDLDDALAGQQMFQVLDADPSQLRAVWAARNGQSFVLQGPPGTGKTQTIANIISECIAVGKRVLFVSQKMAALDAVFKRLQDKGLGQLCLEAHSHKATKQEVLSQLDEALNGRLPPSSQQEDLPQQLAQMRRGLNEVVEELHRVREPLGLTLYQANGIVSEAADVPDLPFVFICPEAVAREQYDQLEGLAERLSQYHSLFSEALNHPWRGIRANHFSLNLQTQVRVHLGDLQVTLEGVEKKGSLLAHLCGVPPPQHLDEADRLLQLAPVLVATTRPPMEWFEQGALTELRQMARKWSSRFSSYKLQRTNLLRKYSETVFSLAHKDLQDSLGSWHEARLAPAFGKGWQRKAADDPLSLTELLSRLNSQALRLSRGLALLGPLCGIEAPRTLSAARQALRIANKAGTNPKPRPIWFDEGMLPVLQRQADEACEQHVTLAEQRAEVLKVFNDRLFRLDLAELKYRYITYYTGAMKYLRPRFYKDRNQLRSALEPGMTLPQDVSPLLIVAVDVQEREAWVRANEAELSRQYGIHYRGMDTDWKALKTALSQTEAIIAECPKRVVPEPLRNRLIASGTEVEAISEQYEQTVKQFNLLGQEFQRFQTWRERDDLPFTDRPLSQVGLSELAQWVQELHDGLSDHLKARSAIEACRLDGSRTASAAELIADLQTAHALVDEDAAMKAEESALRTRYASFYQGLGTDWEKLLEAIDGTNKLCDQFPDGAVPTATKKIAVDGDVAILADIQEVSGKLRELRSACDPSLSYIGELFPPERLQWAGHDLRRATFEDIRAWLRLRLDRLSDMEQWIGFQNLRTECEDVGLLSFLDTTSNRVPPDHQVVPAFRKRFHQLWIDAATDNITALRQFRGEQQADKIARFAVKDVSQITSAPGAVRNLARSRRPAQVFAHGEIGVLKAELNRKRHKPIRRLFSDIPNLLLTLKPCLMMSPLTVSLFLDPTRIRFDTIIFDEASQIFVQDALGALLRGPQAIIAGDSQQLPPTSFFLGLQDEADEDDIDQPVSGDFESVLKAAGAIASEASKQLTEYPLQWHYRSRHESLIAFSRKRFYRHLYTFPSPAKGSAIQFVHVPKGVYRAGTRRDNPIEAARVVDLALAQKQRQPELSVGVITFSQAQQDAIVTEVETRKRVRPQLETTLKEEGPEAFFVKNIENVQGDERDVIFLSVGYARDSFGKLAMRFGPLNTDGGERRLNVAVTRARVSCTVVSSMLPADIISDRPGPRLLREYMELALRAGTDDGLSSGAEPMEVGAFEAAVGEALRGCGYDVHHNVGLFEVRIDLAVMARDAPKRYVIGIECDGLMYRDAETARARDRLRPSVLKSLGWRLERVWSSDWVRDKEGELNRLKAAIERAMAGEPEILPDQISPVETSDTEADSTKSGAGDATEVDRAGLVYDMNNNQMPGPLVKESKEGQRQNSSWLDSSSESGPTVRYRAASLPPGIQYYKQVKIALPGMAGALYDNDARRRATFLQELVEQEGPIAVDDAVQRLAEAAGLLRAGSRIKQITEDTIETLISNNTIRRGDDFLWSTSCECATPRVPRPGEQPRPINFISREEIGELAIALLRAAFGMRREELIVETARLLGYKNTGVNIRERINASLSLLELDERIHVQGGQIRALEV